jgi:23S rRNA pseudouridine1911/1915/1917 synthase
MLLLDLLQKKYPTAKRTTLRRMLEDGRVVVEGRVVRVAKMELPETADVRVDERPRQTTRVYSLAPLERVHEDADILVIVKPAGLLTSTVANEKRPTAVATIRRYLEEREPRARVGVIHRLDRDATGLLVFSKNNEAYESLKTQFFKHSVERVYTAVVHNVVQPSAGRIESRLVEMADGKVKSTRVEGKGERAVTDYEMVKYDRKLKMSLMKVTLLTGRKHQIRVHLAEKGAPIVGDVVYGPDPEPKTQLLLAATTLVLTHPRTGERMHFQAQPPEDVLRLFPSELK